MRTSPFLLPTYGLLTLLLTACGTDGSDNQALAPVAEENWARRAVDLSAADSLERGITYLSSYSVIYARSEDRKMSLTGTISMRNINPRDTVFIERAEYHQTDGQLTRSYFERPIYLAPLETVEIIITEEDVTGGTGDNFMFYWVRKPGTHDPFFEGVFITIYGQQGISFTTRGIRVE